MNTAWMPKDGRPLRLLLLRPPRNLVYGSDSREAFRKIGSDVRRILQGTAMVVVPPDWQAEVVEVDGVTIADH